MMKKIITLCFFAFAMVLGTQTVNAQSMVEVNSLAAKKTQELKKVVKFNTDTENLVYEAYQKFIQKKYNVDKLAAAGEEVSGEEMNKVNKMLDENFKKIFTQEEFERYLSFVDSQK